MPAHSRSRVPVNIEAAGDTHIGGRSHNEDAILLRPDLDLYLVADGAGGQNAGNVAASLAVTTVAHYFERTRQRAADEPSRDALGLPTAARRLSASIQEANTEILAISKHSDKHRGMGTTVVACLFDMASRELHVGHVGDSRLYRLREGRFELLTQDHSLINDVLELRPTIADERIKRLPQNVITRALGMMDNLRVEMRTHQVAHGDRYLLCSDGLTDAVADDQLAEALSYDVPCDELVALLVQMALDGRSDDNIAALVIDCSLPGGSPTKNRPMKTSRRKASRPKMPKVAMPEQRARVESMPEIVLLDEEDEGDRPSFHMVPAPPDDSDLVDAFGEVIGPSPASPVKHRRSSNPDVTVRDTMDYGDPEEPSDPGRIALVGEGAGGIDEADAPEVAARPSAKRPTPGVGIADIPARSTRGRGGGKSQGKDSKKKVFSTPRLNKGEADDAPTAGATRRPAESEPPPGGVAPTRGFTKAPPGPWDRKAPRKPIPPIRPRLDTSDLHLEENVVCHACNSVIDAAAVHCVYCGAPTGFVRDGE